MEIKSKYQIEKVASKDVTRLPINHAFLIIDKPADNDATTNGEGRIVATCGRALAEVPVKVGSNDVGGQVKNEALKEARRMAKKSDTFAIGLNGDCKLLDGRTYPREAINFPRTDMIWPKKEKVFSIKLDVELLKNIADALGADGKVSLTFYGAEDAIMVHPYLNEDDGAKGLLMPMK